MSTDDEISTIHAPDVNEVDLRLSANYAESSVSDSDNEKYEIGRFFSSFYRTYTEFVGRSQPTKYIYGGEEGVL